MRAYTRGNTRLVELDSTSDWLASYPDPPGEPAWHTLHTSSAAEWYGAPSRAAAIARARTGYPEMAERIAALHATIAIPTLATTRRKPAWCEDGDELDFDRLHADRPSCFRGSIRIRGIRRNPMHFTLAIDIVGSCGEQADAIAWTSIAGLALADMLATSGRSVALIALVHLRHAYRCGARNFYGTIAIKEAGEPTNLSALAAATSPGLFRTLGFNMAVAQATRADVDDGLGHPLHVLPDPAIWSLPGALVVIPPIRTESDAHAWLADQSTKINDPQGDLTPI